MPKEAWGPLHLGRWSHGYSEGWGRAGPRSKDLVSQGQCFDSSSGGGWASLLAQPVKNPPARQ